MESERLEVRDAVTRSDAADNADHPVAYKVCDLRPDTHKTKNALYVDAAYLTGITVIF